MDMGALSFHDLGTLEPAAASDDLGHRAAQKLDAFYAALHANECCLECFAPGIDALDGQLTGFRFTPECAAV